MKHYVINMLSLLMAMATVGFTPFQAQPDITQQQAAASKALVIPDVPQPASINQCKPIDGEQRRMWICDGRHTLTFSEPMSYCHEIGREYHCERE